MTDQPDGMRMQDIVVGMKLRRIDGPDLAEYKKVIVSKITERGFEWVSLTHLNITGEHYGDPDTRISSYRPVL